MKNKVFLHRAAIFFMSASFLPCMAHPYRADLLGKQAPVSPANRTIDIKPNTHYVNVQAGEVVTFVVDSKVFSWHFDSAPFVRSFSLDSVAPPGVLDHVVQTYVTPNPLYTGE